MYKRNIDNFNMISTINSASPQLQQHQQKQQHQQHHFALSKRREKDGGRGSCRIKKCPQHLLAYSIISILVFLCWLPDFIVALKDVSVTIPQAVKRGSNAMLTCNYDMENDTLYSVKWYKGRREFYRYTPKENPAMKVFPSQSGLNVERNLSNQSHVVLLAVPLNISGKFTCEISVEAPSFQTAMVSGEMEVVELPEEQASVTGIQPRYRIGDLVDGNCSIKYSKPAANLTWTINGIVVPPHHIKTYQIEKYEETNLESVMSAVHFMVTTQHFVKGQMRLKCTASIFDIFKEEIESIIEEDRPRIMASGQSYPPDHGYGSHGDTDGYEHNESYLTYFSAPKSSASRSAEFVLAKILKLLKQKIYENFQLLMSLVNVRTQNALTTTLVNNNVKNTLDNINRIKMKITFFFVYNIFHLILMKFIITSIVILLIVRSLQKLQQQQQQEKYLTKCLNKKMIEENKRLAYNCIEKIRQMMMIITRKKKWNFLKNKTFNNKEENEQQQEQQQKRGKEENEISYQDANKEECQAKCGHQQKREQNQQQQQNEHCLVANQNVVAVKEKVFQRVTTNITTQQNRNIATRAPTTTLVIDCQHHMSQTFATDTLLTFKTPTLPAIFCPFFNSLPILFSSSLSVSSSTTSLSFAPLSSLPLSTTLGYRKTYAHDSFPLYNVDASKSNNAKYMSKDQTLLMTSVATAAAKTVIVVAIAIVAATTYKTPSTLSTLPPLTTKATTTATTSAKALVLESKLLTTSVLPSLASSSPTSPSLPTATRVFRNNYLMAFIGELLLHQC